MSNPLPVVVVTTDHLFAGTIPVNGRLRDVLNDDFSDVIHLTDANAFPAITPDQPSREVAEVVLMKSHLQAVLITTTEHEAPASRMANRRPRLSAEVAMWAGAAEIAGTVYLSEAHPTIGDVLGTELHGFFAVTDALVTVHSSQWKVPVALVNRSHLAGAAFDP